MGPPQSLCENTVVIYGSCVLFWCRRIRIHTGVNAKHSPCVTNSRICINSAVLGERLHWWCVINSLSLLFFFFYTSAELSGLISAKHWQDRRNVNWCGWVFLLFFFQYLTDDVCHLIDANSTWIQFTTGRTICGSFRTISVLTWLLPVEVTSAGNLKKIHSGRNKHLRFQTSVTQNTDSAARDTARY